MRKVLICLVLLFAACAQDEGTDPLAETDIDSAEDDQTPGVDADERPAAGDSEEPEVDIPDGDPPDELEIDDIKEGKGAAAKEGATVTVNYVGVSWSTEEKFDSSWDAGQPATFSLAQVIPGWTEGIPGMKAGGRRKLTIPPDKAYGDQPPPGSGIKPGETLVFIVDMIDVDAA